MQKIINDVCNTLAVSQGLDEKAIQPYVCEIMDKWQKNKKWFLDRTGGMLTVETSNKITFEMDYAAKRLRFADFRDYALDFPCLRDTYDFLNIISVDEFFANSLETAFEGEFDGIKVPAGMKITKALKYFYPNAEIVEKVQTRASMIIQENKITGILCLSVHPMDFLTSSENGYSWRSCHSLDGDYRSGNLAYMADSSTIIAYIKGDKDFMLTEDLAWNSKKWRMLMFFDESRYVIAAGRQYPFSTKTALDAILDEFKGIIFPNYRSWAKPRWSDQYISNIGPFELDDHYYPIGGKPCALTSMVSYHSNTPVLFFNDLISSSVYKPYFCYNPNMGLYRIGDDKTPVFKIGQEPVPCLICGQTLDNSERMWCRDCDDDYNYDDEANYYMCACCGDRVLEEDVSWVQGEDPLCPQCASAHTVMCVNCDELVYIREAVYDVENEEWYCEGCYEVVKERNNGC